MKPWNVILATLVIFIAGLVTGIFTTRKLQTRPPVPVPQNVFEGPEWIRQRFLERMQVELQLRPDQAERLKHILEDSRERIKILWEIIGPEVQQELKEVRQKIDAELTPRQQRRFDELLRRSRQSRLNGNPLGVDARPANGTSNQPPLRLGAPQRFQPERLQEMRPAQPRPTGATNSGS